MIGIATVTLAADVKINELSAELILRDLLSLIFLTQSIQTSPTMQLK